MSTDNQRCSIETQQRAIAAFAASHALEICETYADIGKSGLTLKQRPDMQRLLADALAVDRDFSTILVHDVSRWGRFQDTDQAAHYEFLCRQAGIDVVYCAERFESSGTLSGSIMKNLKRAMAAEFSRELSSKLTRAHLAGARLGRHQGGPAVYGLRRQVVDESGEPITILDHGERKAVRTFRVVLVHGPDDELKVVRRVFRLYVRDGWTPETIARRFNEEGVPSGKGRPWTHTHIRFFLKNELYTGTRTYNRTTQRLATPLRANPSSEWIRSDVMSPIISKGVFEQAKARMAAPRTHLPPKRMLADLRRLFREHGYLSRELVEKAKGVPIPDTYTIYFGSFARACSMAGFDPPIREFVTGRIFTKKAVLKELRALHRADGFISSFTINANPNLPHSGSIRHYFGSLLGAYEAAGLKTTRSEIMRQANERKRLRGAPRPPPNFRYSAEELLRELKRLLDQDGDFSWVTINADPALPLSSTIIKRFGSIEAARRLARELVPEIPSQSC